MIGKQPNKSVDRERKQKKKKKKKQKGRREERDIRCIVAITFDG